MKRIFNNFLNISVILTIFLSICVSCSKDSLDEDDGANNNGNNINVEDIRLCSEWGLTQEEVIEYMEGYTLDKEEEDYLYFSQNNASLIVSYEFDGGELRSSLLMVIENKNIESKILDIVSEYTKVGSVDDVEIYFSESENAVASYSVEVDDDRTYLTLGITKLHIDSIPNNQIWYINGSTTTPTTPYKEDVFGANIISNQYDAEIGQWVITFDGDVTSIGDGAFKGCNSLISINIPDNVTTIGSHAFYGCSSLKSFYGRFASDDNRCLIINGQLNNFASADLTSYTIPDSVTSIGAEAFVNCNSLKSIYIPKSVITIYTYAFRGCSSLESITIPDSVTSIKGGNIFNDCSSLKSFYGKFASDDHRCLIIDGALHSFAPAGLTSYTISSNVTLIDCCAFDNCSSLDSIIIPNSVICISTFAFQNCSSLTSVYCKPSTPPNGGVYMFKDNASGRKIYVPAGSVDAYKTADGWKDYADAIVGYEF